MTGSMPVPPVAVRQAMPADAPVIDEMLREAAAWVDALGVVMWEDGELEPWRTADEVGAGQFFIAERDGNIAGAVRFQLEDALFWPDLPPGDSAFVHRLVVRRHFKGCGISTALLAWAVERARAVGRPHLRLDCDATRAKLRAIYEGFGFCLHSYRQVGPYYVARYEYPVRALTSRQTISEPSRKGRLPGAR
jgi:GNAT superfamily N-acetyltransferase